VGGPSNLHLPLIDFKLITTASGSPSSTLAFSDLTLVASIPNFSFFSSGAIVSFPLNAWKIYPLRACLSKMIDYYHEISKN